MIVLHHTALSTHCRPVVAFLAESGLGWTSKPVDMNTGEHKSPAFLALNPAGALPVIEHEGLVLSESSAILKYLADVAGSPLYPTDAKARARVNERMDWFNTGFEAHVAHELVYPQVLPHHARATPELTRATAEWGKKKCEDDLALLDRHLLAGREWIAGDAITIADLLGASIASLPRVIGARFDAYPNVAAWLGRVESRASWQEANVAFVALEKALAGATFVTIGR